MTWTGAFLLALTASTGSTWALFRDSASGGPEPIASAALTPAPTGLTVTNGGCSGTNQQTNLGVSWTDTQAGSLDAAGGSLITGYTVSQAATAGGPYSTAGTVTGGPPATTFAATPAVAATPVALVANGGAGGSNRVYPISEATLSAGAGIAIGGAGSEANAIQISPDGLTAVIAESTAGQVQVLTWSVGAWVLTKTLAVTTPIALAISPVPSIAGFYVAYVVSDPGGAVNGAVYPVTLNAASSTLGAPLAVQHQADPTAITITPDGTRAYVANYNSGTVSTINTATSAVATVALPGATPHPIAVTTTFDSSHVYVADRANSFIDDITVASGTVTAHVTLAAGGLNDRVLTTPGNPNVLAMLPNGKSLYVAEFGTAEIQVVNTALAASPDTVGATISTGGGSQPIDLAASPNGCLVYVADWPSDHIFSINTTTNVQTTVLTASCQTQDPQAMEVSPDNKYLLIPENYSCGNVQMLNTATNVATTIGAVGGAPTMVAFPPVPIWYQAAATHTGWSSNPSASVSYPVGWNPGGWQ